jgi:hypothetical protein
MIHRNLCRPGRQPTMFSFGIVRFRIARNPTIEFTGRGRIPFNQRLTNTFEKHGVLPNSLSYLRFLAKVIKAIPMIKSGIETQSVPKSATLFRFRTANTAAATRKRIPMTRRVLDDKIRPPSGSLI